MKEQTKIAYTIIYSAPSGPPPSPCELAIRAALAAGDGAEIVRQLCVGCTDSTIGERGVVGGIPSFNAGTELGIDWKELFKELPEKHRLNETELANDAIRMSLPRLEVYQRWLVNKCGSKIADTIGGPNLNASKTLFQAMMEKQVNREHKFEWGWVFENPIFIDGEFIRDEAGYIPAGLIALSAMPDIKVLGRDVPDGNSTM